jgi:hypothetical protein
MAKVFILSTMTNAVNYRVYRTIGENNPSKGPRIVAPVTAEDIIIRGGANRPSTKSGFGDRSEDINGNVLWHARGVITPIEEDQYERLKGHWLFQKHLEGKFVEVISGRDAASHDSVKKVAVQMNQQDPHAQLTKETVAQRIKVKTPAKDIAQEW